MITYVEITIIYFNRQEGVEEFIEDGSHHNNPDNIYVELNNQSFELLQTIKDLEYELQTVKEYNERILRAHEELNQILLDKLHDKEMIKEKNMNMNMELYPKKRKGKKLKFSDNEVIPL